MNNRLVVTEKTHAGYCRFSCAIVKRLVDENGSLIDFNDSHKHTCICSKDEDEEENRRWTQLFAAASASVAILSLMPAKIKIKSAARPCKGAMYSGCMHASINV